jgi:ABC-type branched-subunit amino acid transport system substrate-binding protein
MANPTTAISEFRKLIGVNRALGVFVQRSPVGMAINPISLSSSIPILGGVGDKRFAEGNKFAFQIWSKSDEEGGYLADIFKRRGFDTAAMVTTDDDWTSFVSDGFRQKFTISGKILMDEDVLPTDTDFKTILHRFKNLKPKVIFANLGLSQIGVFVKQAREQNIQIPIYSNFWASKKDVIESAGVKNLDGVRFVEMDTNYPTLKKEIFSKYGTTPSGSTLTAYIATLLINQAILSNTQLPQTPKELYERLLDQSEVKTPDGALPIKDRCVQFPLVEKVMRDGKAETVDGVSS